MFTSSREQAMLTWNNSIVCTQDEALSIKKHSKKRWWTYWHLIFQQQLIFLVMNELTLITNWKTLYSISESAIYSQKTSRITNRDDPPTTNFHHNSSRAIIQHRKRRLIRVTNIATRDKPFNWFLWDARHEAKHNNSSLINKNQKCVFLKLNQKYNREGYHNTETWYRGKSFDLKRKKRVCIESRLCLSPEK